MAVYVKYGHKICFTKDCPPTFAAMSDKQKKPTVKTDSRKTSSRQHDIGEDFETFISSMEKQNRVLGKIMHYLSDNNTNKSNHKTD